MRAFCFLILVICITTAANFKTSVSEIHAQESDPQYRSDVKRELSSDIPKELPGLHNVHRASSLVLLGGEPHGQEAFEQLQKLGIKTIVSVDGATPDVATAKKHGIRYVHIPIGYDAIPSDAALALTQVAREMNAPVYVHCHHGRHRGPAAAAVLCLSNGSISLEHALDLMKSAGTGKDYVGLWRDVKAFKPASNDASLPELVEIAKVESLTTAMASVGRAFDNVKLCGMSDWNTPADHPDLVPAAEARLVQEGLHESLRHCDTAASDEFRQWLSQSDDLAEQLCQAISARKSADATSAFRALEAKCVECHTKHRN